MGGILLLAGFEACGVATTTALALRREKLVQVWLGLALGLLYMMWAPALFAFFLRFTLAAQFCGLGLAAACAGGAWVWRRKKGGLFAGAEEGPVPWKLFAALAVPMLILGIYLQWTHTIRNVDGALHVGQSTYGDLCLHLGIATGLKNAAFPPTYTLLPGADLCYPFLADSMVTSMLLMRTPLATAFVVTGSLMLMLVYAGFCFFAWEITRSRLAVTVGFLLFFFNGGLGFFHVLDGAAGDATALKEVFTGFYRTPTNQPALNLRWSNVLCDMMIPQRTLLAGWTVLLPALYLLTKLMRERRGGTALALGIWAGAMPMIHTHSFLALGLISAGAMASCLIRARGRLRTEVGIRFLTYGGIAVALALPQLLRWTFPQTAEGGSLAVRLNWVNNNGDNTFIDGYFWFWIKNVGIAYLLIVPACLGMDRVGRALALGAGCIYVIAEIFQFQPNPYDNNKLFYAAYMTVTPMIGLFVARVWKRLKGLKCRGYLLAVFLLVSMLSAGLTMGREVVSDYVLFSAEEAAAGAFAAETEQDSVFLTGSHHNNPIPALGGRQIICGTPSYLYYHGVDYSQQKADEKRMMENPGENRALFEKYGVDYVYVSGYERGEFTVDEAYFRENCETVFQEGNVCIYKFTK